MSLKQELASLLRVPDETPGTSMQKLSQLLCDNTDNFSLAPKSQKKKSIIA